MIGDHQDHTIMGSLSFFDVSSFLMVEALSLREVISLKLQ